MYCTAGIVLEVQFFEPLISSLAVIFAIINLQTAYRYIQKSIIVCTYFAKIGTLQTKPAVQYRS